MPLSKGIVPKGMFTTKAAGSWRQDFGKQSPCQKSTERHFLGLGALEMAGTNENQNRNATADVHAGRHETGCGPLSRHGRFQGEQIA
jgi:hypothetical protein